MNTKEDSKDKKKVVEGSKARASMLDRKPVDKKSETNKKQQTIIYFDNKPIDNSWAYSILKYRLNVILIGSS